eukprot:TRINITY_DN1254_c0_g1_i1.p1 TRINITY_DN1254_c0_g1~~TRINITY_DN1254_c0_g1_i1.p1  ORF type:complete len:153 (-),score=60.03 TRINITY_DN1254_c0_g1_i1:37-495(-)
MRIQGGQPATAAGKGAAIKKFQQFIDVGSKGHYKGSWQQLPVSVLCSEGIWLEFVHWMMHTDEKMRAGGSVVEYVRKCLWVVHDVHGSDPAHQEFFSVLNPATVLSSRDTWLKGCVREVYPNPNPNPNPNPCLLYTSPSPRDRTRSRMPSSA